MGFITCIRCEKEWDVTHVEHEMSAPQRMSLHKGLGCPACVAAGTDHEWERRLARRSIAESLEEVSDSFITVSLRCTQGIGRKSEIIPGTEVYQQLEGFFLACQRVEERIKVAAAAEHITQKQVDHLNGELNNAVVHMRELAQKSPALSKALQTYTSKTSMGCEDT